MKTHSSLDGLTARFDALRLLFPFVDMEIKKTDVLFFGFVFGIIKVMI